MASGQDQSEYCKICKKAFTNWDAFFMHKIQSKNHISCCFCGRDFKTREGCSRHQHQDHAKKQDLLCAGCGMKFVRAGSYISHIEQEQCPVIHHSKFEARRAEKEKIHEALKLRNHGRAATFVSVYGDAIQKTDFDDGPLEFDEAPKQTSWETWGDDSPPKFDKQKDFPALPLQDYKNGGLTVPDLLTGLPWDEKVSAAWMGEKELFTDTPKAIRPPKELLSAMAISNEREEEYHPYDPDNPEFDIRKYYNPVTEKYRCAWPGCTKLQNHREGLIQHLRSPAHMDKKLRCPACLRQYSSATALIQHAEAQSIRCQIRDSHEYRGALDQITGGFVDTKGRHEDYTVRYIARADSLAAGGAGSISQLATAHNTYWVKRENDREKQIKEMAANADW